MSRWLTVYYFFATVGVMISGQALAIRYEDSLYFSSTETKELDQKFYSCLNSFLDATKDTKTPNALVADNGGDGQVVFFRPKTGSAWVTAGNGGIVEPRQLISPRELDSIFPPTPKETYVSFAPDSVNQLHAVAAFADDTDKSRVQADAIRELAHFAIFFVRKDSATFSEDSLTKANLFDNCKPLLTNLEKATKQTNSKDKPTGDGLIQMRPGDMIFWLNQFKEFYGDHGVSND